MTIAFAERLSHLRKRVQDRIGASRFRTWFGDSTELQLHDSGLDVLVRNEFVGNWIASNFMDELVGATRELFDDGQRAQVRIVPNIPLEIATRAAGTFDAAATVTAPAAAEKTVSPSLPRRPVPVQGLRHDLASFVVGPSNQLAFAAAQQIVRAPGASFKLLVLHSPCGLGKTHLLQGICAALRQQHPTLEWRYVSGEQFTNEYITSVKTGRIDAFRARFRSVDVLVVDDIHFLAHKKATQEEFLHTFNAIDTGGKAIILSSDKHPRAIAALSTPLVDRLIGGMVVQIDPPEFATRREILRRRAAELRQAIPDEVLDCLAQHVTRNVRELEGALHSIAALAALTSGPLTVELARKVVEASLVRTQPALDVTEIERVVAARFQVTPEQIHSKSRDRTVTLARGVAMLLVRRHTPLSFPEIGRAMGKKNHSTVLMAVQRIDKLLHDDAVVEWKTAAGQHEAPIRGLVEAFEAELFPSRPQA